MIGTQSFTSITEWNYKDSSGSPVLPSPLDPSSPRRTTSQSTSIVRYFQGKLVGRTGATIRSKGGDTRVVVKEWTGEGSEGGVRLGTNELRVSEGLNGAHDKRVRGGGKGGEYKKNKILPVDTPAYVVEGTVTAGGNVVSGVPVTEETWVRAVGCEPPSRE
ncbi:hypothetical protein TrRE_jg6308, partial [Triparma retinervis]